MENELRKVEKIAKIQVDKQKTQLGNFLMLFQDRLTPFSPFCNENEMIMIITM